MIAELVGGGRMRSAIAFGVLLFALLAFAQNPICAQKSNAGEPRSFKDCVECPEMVAVPPGTFLMGISPEEEEREKDPPQWRAWSLPQHEVTLREGFALSRYDVTRREFAAFVSETGYRAGDRCWKLVDNPQSRRYEQREVIGRSWDRPGFSQTEQDPVVCVSWADAMNYVDWLKTKTRRAYRLPSEAEWEYATRAGTTTARYWGDRLSDACRYANVSGYVHLKAAKYPLPYERFFPCREAYLATSPVGSFEPNAFGLYDMLGNVAQWVEDCWSEGYRAAPLDGSASHSGDCRGRVIRGGSYNNPPYSVRAGNRGWLGIGMRMETIGFRVAAPADALVSELRSHLARGTPTQEIEPPFGVP